MIRVLETRIIKAQPMRKKQSPLKNHLAMMKEAGFSVMLAKRYSTCMRTIYYVKDTDNWNVFVYFIIKWRSLPGHVDPNTLPDVWSCEMNTSDPLRMSWYNELFTFKTIQTYIHTVHKFLAYGDCSTVTNFLISHIHVLYVFTHKHYIHKHL